MGIYITLADDTEVGAAPEEPPDYGGDEETHPECPDTITVEDDRTVFDGGAYAGDALLGDPPKNNFMTQT